MQYYRINAGKILIHVLLTLMKGFLSNIETGL